MSGAISSILLAVTGLLCVWGIFTRHYDDNLPERAGMALLALWCLARLPEKAITGFTEPVHLILHAGLVVYAVGKAWRVYSGLRKGGA